MKPSMYNFIWAADDPDKAILFNSLTTSLAEVEKTYIDLLDMPQFDYNSMPADVKEFIDGLKPGGFVLDDSVDELKILKFAYNSNKYSRSGLGFTIAPTLRCNFTCSYCYEQAGDEHDKRDGQNAFMPEKVQQELLSFVEKAAKTVKFLAINWYGGEPLLGHEIIFDLSKKMIAIAEENKIAYSAGMITNGYLFAKNPDIVGKLKDSWVRKVQITLDGPPEVHNSRRMLKGSCGPTFDQILEGIKLLKAHEMDIDLRINVDRSNMDEALKVLDILEENNLKDIDIHLGHVTADTAGCKSIESSCTTMEEFTLLHQNFHEVLRQKDFKASQKLHYPCIARSCGANRMNTYVIDPDGDMYKCWSEIGDKAARIGNIADMQQRSRDERMGEIRWLAWEPFEYPDCVKCKLLPICMGSCGYRAMFVNNNQPECVEWKFSLEHYVRARFYREKKLRSGGTHS